MIRVPVLLVLAASILVAPTVAAADCATGVEQLCDAASAARFDAIFGSYGDVVLILLALVALALVIVIVLSLLYKIRPTRLLRFEVAEKLREVEPGSSARFKLELENVNRRYPVEVFLERPEVPSGWTHDVLTSILLPSGFRVPQAVGETGSFPLSSEAKHANRALIEVKLTAPSDVKAEETLDYEMRAVPVYRGRLRRRKAKRARLTALVTPHLPAVHIVRVVHEPERITAGAPVLTRAYLANKGEKDARDVSVKFTLNGEELDRKIVPALQMRAETQIEFNWVPRAGENKIRVAIES